MKINPLDDRHYNLFKEEVEIINSIYEEDLWPNIPTDGPDTLTNYYPVEDAIYGPRTAPISEEEAIRILSEGRYQQEVPGGSTPSQYGLPEGATELQDLIEYRNMNFAMGNILKAAYRYGTCRHSDRRRDLHKILWFANRELKRLDNGL